MAAGLGYLIETLTRRAPTRWASEYGLIAESIYHPDDYSLGHLPAAQAKRAGMTASRSPPRTSFTASTSSRKQPAISVLLQERTEGRADRRRRSHLHLRQQGQSRTARHHGPVPSWCRSTIGKAPMRPGKKRNIDETTLDPPLGSGPYQVKSFQGRPVDHLRTGQGLLGRRPAGQYRHQQFRRDRVHLFPRPQRSSSRLQGRSDSMCGPDRGTKEWDTQYDFPAVKKGNVIKAAFTTKMPSRCRVSCSIRGGRNSPIRACARRSTSPMISKAACGCSPSATTTSAHRAISRIPSSPAPACRRAASSKS